MLQESENYTQIKTDSSNAHGGFVFIETTEANQTSFLIYAIRLHSRDSLCGCSVGLLRQIHGSFRVAVFVDTVAVIWQPRQWNQHSLGVIFCNSLHILVRGSNLSDSILRSPYSLFLIQPLCKKGLMDRDWNLISTIKGYIEQGAESRLCKSWLVIICELHLLTYLLRSLVRALQTPLWALFEPFSAIDMWTVYAWRACCVMWCIRHKPEKQVNE